MNQVPVRLGPMALLMTVVCICMAVMSVLAFTTARADRSLADKYAVTVAERYRLEARGQEYLQGVRAGLADMGESDENGVSWVIFEEEMTRLRVGINQQGEIVSWRFEKEWKPDTSVGNLWSG